MLSDASLTIVTAYWAAEMGLAPDALFAEPLQVVPHGPRLADYDGVFALFRNGAATISLPPERMEPLRSRLPDRPLSPEQLAELFGNERFRVIGPAYIGYAERIVSPAPPAARILVKEDFPLVDELQRACAGDEWDHGGSEVETSPAAGAFEDGRLASLAGYEVWDESIAHISVVTHPSFRGRGLGRAVVARLAMAALEAGLVPQYRTLDANAASIRIAEALGFARYATSVAVRLNGGC